MFGIVPSVWERNAREKKRRGEGKYEVKEGRKTARERGGEIGEN